MKSLVVTKTGGPEVREIPAPVINEKQALVKMVCCGICNGTDAKLIHRSFKGFPEEVYPIMLGHEAVGKVVETGSADKELYGELNSGWGGYSEYGVVHDEGAYPKGEAPECAFAQTVVPDYIDPVDAAMVITLREVLSSIRRFGIKEGDKVVVFGCGGTDVYPFFKTSGCKGADCL